MRPPRVELMILSGLLLVLGMLVLVGLGGAAQAPSRIAPDSSAIVVLAMNQTQVPVEVFLKVDTTYNRLGVCPPVMRCLFVVPSARLRTLESFRLAGLAHGEAVPFDSPPYRRVPGTVNVAMYTLSAGEPPQTRSGSGVSRVY